MLIAKSSHPHPSLKNVFFPMIRPIHISITKKIVKKRKRKKGEKKEEKRKKLKPEKRNNASLR